jgi:hypothetical protein
MNKDTKLIWKNIDALKPYEHNAKEHDEVQVKNIAKSIEKYGWQNPVLIDKDNVIIAGHGRVLGAKELGLKDIPCIYADDLTEEQVREYRILDNKLNESSWIDDELDFELEELDFSDFDLDFDINEYFDEGYGTDFSLPDGGKSEICQMTFTLHEKQKELIEYAISLVKDDISETFGNANSNGNAIYEVVRQWAEQRK